MKHTHTRIVFCIKYEPVFEDFQKELEGYKYHLIANSDGKYIVVTITVNKIITPIDDEMVLINNIKIQFEAITHYTPLKK
jgi:Fe-S cluster biosynthesis and repair protein YggX